MSIKKEIKDAAKVYIGGFADQRNRKTWGQGNLVDDAVEVAAAFILPVSFAFIVCGLVALCN